MNVNELISNFLILLFSNVPSKSVTELRILITARSWHARSIVEEAALSAALQSLLNAINRLYADGNVARLPQTVESFVGGFNDIVIVHKDESGNDDLTNHEDQEEQSVLKEKFLVNLRFS